MKNLFFFIFITCINSLYSAQPDPYVLDLPVGEDIYVADARCRGQELIDFTAHLCSSPLAIQLQQVITSSFNILAYDQIVHLCQMEPYSKLNDFIPHIALYTNNPFISSLWHNFQTISFVEGEKLYHVWHTSLEKLVVNSPEYSTHYNYVTTSCRQLYTDTIRLPVRHALQENLAQRHAILLSPPAFPAYFQS